MRAEHEAAFEAFVAARSDDLLRVGHLLTGDRGHAEDLLQTALIKTYRHWGRLTNTDDPTAFVRRVMVTTYAGWRRRVRVSEFVSTPPLLAGDAGRRRSGRRVEVAEDVGPADRAARTGGAERPDHNECPEGPTDEARQQGASAVLMPYGRASPFE